MSDKLDKLILLKTAQLAKDKGFDLKCRYHYIEGSEYPKTFGILRTYNIIVKSNKNLPYKTEGIYSENQLCTAPTQSLLKSWLREEYGLHIVIIPTVTSNWTYKTIKVISKLDNDVIAGIKSVSDLPPYKEVSGKDFSTHDDALEDALYENLKQL